jgi:anti-sigma factor RsiW
MKAHDEVQVELVSYARNELSDSERHEVDDHLKGCADCRAELEEIQSAGAMASLMPLEFQPPRRLEERTFALLDLEREKQDVPAEAPSNVRTLSWDRPRSTRRSGFGVRALLAPGIAAAFVAMAVLTLSLWSQTADLENRLAEAESGSSEAAVVDLVSASDSDVGGTARLIELGEDNYRIVLEADDLPAPPNGYHYELWMGSEDGWTSAGTFTDGDSDQSLEFRTAVDPVEFSIVDITLEPIDGKPNRGGKEIMRGTVDLSELGA